MGKCIGGSVLQCQYASTAYLLLEVSYSLSTLLNIQAKLFSIKVYH